MVVTPSKMRDNEIQAQLGIATLSNRNRKGMDETSKQGNEMLPGHINERCRREPYLL